MTLLEAIDEVSVRSMFPLCPNYFHRDFTNNYPLLIRLPAEPRPVRDRLAQRYRGAEKVRLHSAKYIVQIEPL